MKSNELFTIGYEGKNIEVFISNLKYFNITRLIDVRETPLSRKKGFSKSALQERLKSKNIEYVHIKSLGCPIEIRNRLKIDLDYKYFFKAYSNYLKNNYKAIKEVNQYINEGINCIMCFERYYNKCHRYAVANKVKEFGGNGLKITHI